MCNHRFVGMSLFLLAVTLATAQTPPRSAATPDLWHAPATIATLDLRYGSGSASRAPRGPMTFVEEDLGGTSPKFVVRDAQGTKWKVKLGLEVRPETVAVRLLWAMGYYVREDYFVPQLSVTGVHLQRGAQLVGVDGSVRDGRWERERDGAKKIGDWKWRDNPMRGTRPFNGLRVMMALLNNWDLKDDNNAVYRVSASRHDAAPREIYMVSDVGASFGATHKMVPPSRGKNNLADYRRSSPHFVSHASSRVVDFDTPGRPSWIYAFQPTAYLARVRMQWIGRHVPRADVEWIAAMLAQLRPSQIHDAFAAAGYTPATVEAFSQALEQRIAELNALRQ